MAGPNRPVNAFNGCRRSCSQGRGIVQAVAEPRLTAVDKLTQSKRVPRGPEGMISRIRIRQADPQQRLNGRANGTPTTEQETQQWLNATLFGGSDPTLLKPSRKSAKNWEVG